MKKLILLITTSVYLQAADISGRDIINNMVSSDKVLTTEMNIKLIHTEIKHGKEKIKIRELVRYNKRYSDGIYKSKSLIRFQKPDIIKGTGFLVWANRTGGNEQWLFLPKVNSVRKIEAQEKTKSFMNTEFSYEDLDSFNQPDEQYFKQGEEEINGVNCYIVEVIGHSNTQYKRRLAWIDSQDWLLQKVEFYDKNNKLIKILTTNDYLKSEQFCFTKKMKMQNIQTGSNTIMEISDIKYNIDLPKSYFTKEALVNPQ